MWDLHHSYMKSLHCLLFSSLLHLLSTLLGYLLTNSNYTFKCYPTLAAINEDILQHSVGEIKPPKEVGSSERIDRKTPITLVNPDVASDLYICTHPNPLI